MSRWHNMTEEQKEGARRRNREYYKRAKEKKLQYQREYRAKNRDKVNANRNRWLKESGKGIEIKHRRRALERGAEGSFTAAEFRALGNTCALCGRDDVPMTVDHIVPLSKGGSNYISNIQPLCKSCNCAKSDACEIAR